MTPDQWERRKKAVQEYTKFRPLLVFQADWQPTPDVKVQDFPDPNYFGIETMDYGVQEDYFVVMTTTTADIGWAVQGTSIALTPAPPVDTVIAVQWRSSYVPDELTMTHPTLPPQAIEFVEMLEKAILLDEKIEEVNNGPVKYALGQKMVDRTGVAAILMRQASELRRVVHNRLHKAFGGWA